MPKAKTSGSSRPMAPALSPEAKENQMIALAMDLAEKQLRDGTASSQVITHFLKIGTTKFQYECEKLQNETELLRSKRESIDSAKKAEELYADAIAAMKKYSGHNDE
jgi:hypothetical protein